MAIVLVPRQGQRPARIPGIVLEDSMRVGVLAGHETVSSLAQSLLSTVYLNNRANVLDHPNGNKLAGFGGHAVIAASALASRWDVHSVVHKFNTRSFGTEVTRQGLQDIHIGQQTVRVRAGVLALNRVGLEVASHYQPPTGDMFGSGLSGEAGNVALTLAATMSNPDAGSVDLGRAFAEMSR
ncbi:hypothetical protein IPL68_00100 [Candidatus Saccharibacteria bacterium]|nr:MAG: hypothetical protein IPL68_00100 [Candidatus Saccharibacteria bacterium]